MAHKFEKSDDSPNHCGECQQDELPDVISTSLVAKADVDVSCITSSDVHDTGGLNSTIGQGISGPALGVGPQYKDQTQSVLGPLHMEQETFEDRGHETMEGAFVVEDTVYANDNNVESLDTPSVHAQTIIPMAEAFVIADDGGTVVSSIDPHVVQIDEGTCSTASPHTTLTKSVATGASTSVSTNDLTNTSSESHKPEGSGISEAELKRLANEAILSERKFWIRIIIAAVVLNTLLVGGVVVAGFCLSGNCSSSKGPPVVEMVNVSYSFSPTSAPTSYGTAGWSSSSGSASDSAEIQPINNTAGLNPSFTEPTMNSTISDLNPNRTSPSVNDSLITTIATLTLVPTDYSTLAPGHGNAVRRTVSPSLVSSGASDKSSFNSTKVSDTNSGSTTNSSSKKVPIWKLIVIAVALEVIIVVLLTYYYRKWTRRRASFQRKLEDAAASVKFEAENASSV